MQSQTTYAALSPTVSHERYMQRIRELASTTAPDSETLLSEASALFAQLKALNRATNAATRDHKQRTAEARQAMDHTHLGLQNLMYERRHFEKEIEKCRQFASVYQDIPLYPLDEFLARAPQEVRTEDILKNEHQLMLNRLSFELAERQRLDEQRKRLIQERDDLLKESREQQARLDMINTEIERVSKAGLEAQTKVTELVPVEVKRTEDSITDNNMETSVQLESIPGETAGPE
ncbi:Fms-interacting protein-domain-containing protein [Hysterangium stoloniferum]|nr:Fms-interacting protein-domain-containing protein [Hysterangium stoloniferum]